MFNKWVLSALLLNFLIKADFECSVGVNKPEREKGTDSFMGLLRKFINKILSFFYKPHKIEPAQINVNKSDYTKYLHNYTKKNNHTGLIKKKIRLEPSNFSVEYFPKIAWDGRPEMNTEQLIAAHGYLSESHTVITKDGYLITMHRVVRNFGHISNKVVMLHHGILGSSADWLLLGTNNALPYILIEKGYDVWLLNARGSRYSRVHVSKTVEISDFWDFSWHEMGVYDLPAAIGYISEVTNSTELNFIGHSMGATALLVLLSTTPEYNDILNSGILLAPLAYMYHARGPIKKLANFYGKNRNLSLSFLGKTEFMRNKVFPENIIQKFCREDNNKSCLNPLLLFGNGGSGLWGDNMTRDILAHVPSGGSAKTVLHYVQLVKSGHFRMFDYGVDGNHRKYKTDTPASYDLEGITLPIAFFSSGSDWLATKSDIQTMLPQLSDVAIHHVVKADNFGHFDFVWSQEARELIYNNIVPIIEKLTKA